ncbi:hypothetical protein ADT25_22970 [Xanthomonas oryzae]|uniref:Uncharacterized protein n=1 Tax=Xanthomonas oryzae TaxID=347 RepID=A0AAP0ZHW0_9XANT|nr:hypothetical protein ADT25_22970 [Xanthomonas oryzae]
MDVASARLCTVTPLLKILNIREFVGDAMPIDTQCVAIEKQQRRQRLVLCAHRHLRIGRQAGEECLDLRLAHLRRMALAAGQDEGRIQLREACSVRRL